MATALFEFTIYNHPIMQTSETESVIWFHMQLYGGLLYWKGMERSKPPGA